VQADKDFIQFESTRELQRMLDASFSPSATALGDIILSVRAMRLIWASGRVILAMTSGPREGPSWLPMRRFSPDLCTNAAWYRASDVRIFRHLLPTEFEAMSLLR
jgi:hypothetical protein